MREKPDKNKAAANLRDKAEKRLKAKRRSLNRPTAAAADPLRLVHELQVHQNELEMRNEELVRARAEAEKALNQYTALFDFAPIGYFILDERGLIRQANLSGAALLGRERSRLVRQPFERFVAPDDRPQFAAFWTRLWQAHGKQACELDLLKRGRSLRHVHIEAAEAGDLPGGERECLVAVTDITVRRHLELALQKDDDSFEHRLKERTSELQQITTELVKGIDFEKVLAELSARFVNVPSGQVDREIMDAERRICELLGLDLSALWQWSDEASGCFTPTHLYIAQKGPQPPGSLKVEDFPWYSRQMLAGRIVGFSSLEELPAEAARDREVCRQLGIKSNLTIPLSVGGELPVGALGLNTTRAERAWPEELVKRLQLVAQIFANALARKRSDQMLRESEERLELAADSAGTGLWSLNLSTGCYWLTRKARELFGFPPDEAVTYDRFLSLVHPKDRELVRETVQTVVQSKNEGRVQYRIFRLDGSLRWIGSRGRVRCKASGEPDSLMGVFLDVTERKNAEEELKRLRLQLWHADRVAQTAAVTASLAHELNQPLAAILTNAQTGLRFMAGGNPDLEEIREILTDIVEDDKRAGAVISGLRDLLRRKETGREKINPADTIRRIVELLHSELLDKQVQLHLDLEPDSLVLADKAQVQQVILNLVMNAVEAMQGQPAGQRRLELTMTHTNAGEALVGVRDSGPGILEDRPEKVFDAFWTTKQEGLGIGLMISRSIIEFHKGRLWFENNPDQGVTFYFTLPLIDA